MTASTPPNSEEDPRTSTRVFLVRHGQTDWNVAGKYHGQENVPLNPVGEAQAAALGEALSAVPFDHIVSSPLHRARDTAAAIAVHHGLVVELDDALLEVDVGDWVGLLEEEVFAKDPEFRVARAMGVDHQLSSTGERISEVGHRVAGAIRAIVDQYPGENILIVSHGFGLQAALGDLMGWTLEASQRVGGMFNCAITELVVCDDRWRLVAHNVGHSGIPEQRSGEVATV